MNYFFPLPIDHNLIIFLTDGTHISLDSDNDQLLNKIKELKNSNTQIDIIAYVNFRNKSERFIEFRQ